MRLRKSAPRQKSPHPPASGSPRKTSNPCKASAAAKKSTREKAGRRRRDAEPPAVSPSPLVSDAPQTRATDGQLSQNSSTCLVRKAVRGRRKQTERSESAARCPDADRTQKKRQNARVSTPPQRQPAHVYKLTANTTLSCPGSPQDTPLSPPTSHPVEGTPKPRRGRPPKHRRLSSTPRRGGTSLSPPQISPVASEKRVCSPNPKALQRTRTRKEAEQKVHDTPPVKRQRKKGSAKAKVPHTRPIRTRFVGEESEVQEPEETLSSSDLSIELSVQEEKLPLTHTLSLEEEEEEEEEELPSFLQQIRQKPFSIQKGLCVWCKMRKFPFWPAVVKSVNPKTKKVSIVFIDEFLVEKKTTMQRGLSVSWRKLKPFDCEESQHFVNIAKEQYGKSFLMCQALISDYNIRIGCGSFAGSVLDYIADDISQPLRSEFLRASSDLMSPTRSLMMQMEDSELQEHEEHPDLLQGMKKVLPDRTQAARKRANQKLVDFIIKKKGAQDRLLAVIKGRQESRWLEDLRKCSRAMVEQVYLEDEEQVFAVYHYLEELWQSVAKEHRHLEKSDRIRFILDVLFPEALIHAMSSVESISLDKAEEKYWQGPKFSNRERQEFDLLIEQQMKLKADDFL